MFQYSLEQVNKHNKKDNYYNKVIKNDYKIISQL